MNKHQVKLSDGTHETRNSASRVYTYAVIGEVNQARLDGDAERQMATALHYANAGNAEQTIKAMNRFDKLTKRAQQKAGIGKQFVISWHTSRELAERARNSETRRREDIRFVQEVDLLSH